MFKQLLVLIIHVILHIFEHIKVLLGLSEINEMISDSSHIVDELISDEKNNTNDSKVKNQ